MPSQSHASRSAEGVKTGFAGADMPDPPEVAIGPAVQDMEIPRSLEDFRLADAAAVPRLPGAFEDGIRGVFRDDRGIAGRRGRVADNRWRRRLTRVDNVDCLTYDGNGGMRRASPLVLGVCGNHGPPPNARPFAEIAVTYQQARLLGRTFLPAEVIDIEPAVGRIPKREGVFGREIVKTFLRRQQDRVPRVVLDRRRVARGGRAVHQHPIIVLFASGPEVMNGLVHDDGVGRGCPLRRLAVEYRIAFRYTLETREHLERYGLFELRFTAKVRRWSAKSSGGPQNCNPENRDQNDEPHRSVHII